MILDYTRSSWSASSSHSYQFQLYRWRNGSWALYRSGTDSVSPAYFDSLARGYYYTARGHRCAGNNCGSWSGWTSNIYLPTAAPTATPTPTPTPTATAIPQQPALPTGLAGTAGDGSVSLDWNDAAHATSYQVQQWDGRAGQWRILPFRESHVSYSYTVSINGSSATVGRLTNGVGYYHRVRAVNGSLSSAWTSYVNTVLPSGARGAAGDPTPPPPTVDGPSG